MANYNEQIIEGQETSWLRAETIIINNPVDGIPSIAYIEKREVVTPSGRKFAEDPGLELLQAQMENPLEEVPLLNPADDSVIGTFTLQQLQLMLYSHYIYLAKKRDAQ